ncbi:hypothetical protein U1Q18_019870 [Sarracenia purpurea var. burkii]
MWRGFLFMRGMRQPSLVLEVGGEKSCRTGLRPQREEGKSQPWSEMLRLSPSASIIASLKHGLAAAIHCCATSRRIGNDADNDNMEVADDAIPVLW